MIQLDGTRQPLELVLEQHGKPAVTRAVAYGELLTIGRIPECSLTVDDPAISRMHVRLRIEPGDIEVTDTSTNGTLADGMVLHRQSVRVAFGRPIALGSSVVRVRPLVSKVSEVSKDDGEFAPTYVGSIVMLESGRGSSAPASSPSDAAVRSTARRIVQTLPRLAGSERPSLRARVGHASELHGDATIELHRAQNIAELLAPIRSFLEDASVTEILINGPNQVFIERRGQLESTSARFDSATSLLAALSNVAQFAGTSIDDDNPILQARLPDGSRLEALLAPLVEGGPAVSIRRSARQRLTLARLVERDTLHDSTADTLRALLAARRNILIAGAAGSGKTSLLSALLGCLPESERVLVLEDARELELERRHVLYMQSRKPDARGKRAVSAQDVLRACLRMRPDRLVVGELQGAETLDSLRAMATGQTGCLATLRALLPRDALTQLEIICLTSDPRMPLPAIRLLIGSVLPVIVQLARMPDGTRKVTQISEVTGWQPEAGSYELRDLYVREPDAAPTPDPGG